MSHSHIWLCHSVTQSTYSEKNSEKKSIKMFSPHDKIPVCTRDTAGTGHGMPRCVKIQHRTRTRATRDSITAGIPIPVTNPMNHFPDHLVNVLDYSSCDGHLLWDIYGFCE